MNSHSIHIAIFSGKIALIWMLCGDSVDPVIYLGGFRYNYNIQLQVKLIATCIDTENDCYHIIYM